MPVTYAHRKLSAGQIEEIQTMRERMGGPGPRPGGPRRGPMSGPPTVVLPEGVTKESVIINGIKGTRVYRKGTKVDKAVMHMHGGGFAWGSSEDALRLMVEANKQLGVDGYSVDYSLLPAQYPVQLNECLAFYQGLLEKGYTKIAVTGDSVGGNLALALTLLLKDKNIRLPVSVVSMSGLPDFTFSGGKEMKDMFAADLPQIGKNYAGTVSLTNPYVSPIYGNFNGFPPLLLQAGSMESFSTDAKYLAKKLENTNCDCTLSIWEGAGHAFGTGNQGTSVSQAGLAQVLDFIRKVL